MIGWWAVALGGIAGMTMLAGYIYDRDRAVERITPYRAGKHWISQDRCGSFIVVRIGLLWEVHCEGSDGLIRRTARVRFWRWINAARIAQELSLAYIAGYDAGRRDEGRQWVEIEEEEEAGTYFTREDHE